MSASSLAVAVFNIRRLTEAMSGQCVKLWLASVRGSARDAVQRAGVDVKACPPRLFTALGDAVAACETSGGSA